jgi:hypothetical protein
MLNTIRFSSFLAALLCTGQLQAATLFVPIANRTDMVYDDINHTLYVTAGSTIARYNTQTHQLLSPITIGSGNEGLLGIDISPEDAGNRRRPVNEQQ